MSLIGGKWYALQVRPRHEETVENRLRRQGYTVYLPRLTRKRQWSDRVRVTRDPMFPGYVFSRFDASIPYRMVESPGVMRIVSFGSTPVPVDETELESARILADSGMRVHPCGIVPGELVTITEGALAGLQGRVIRDKGANRIVVQIFILQRAVFAELDDDAVVVSAADPAASFN